MSNLGEGSDTVYAVIKQIMGGCEIKEQVWTVHKTKAGAMQECTRANDEDDNVTFYVSGALRFNE